MTIQRIKKLFLSPRFWLFMGIAVFLSQALVYPFTQRTHFDEGNYSFLGYNAVQGIYPMYKDGGPWFSYMPLSFLVPGTIHSLFGRDFYVIRLFSVFCAGLAILASYFLARKLGGDLAALITLWLLVASVQTLRHYSLGGPLPFVALFVMASVLILASDVKSPYREVLAIFCITVAVMTRRNMFPSWLVVVIYSAMQQQRVRDFGVVIAASVLLPVAFIWPFWPDIIDEIFFHPHLPSFLARWMIPYPLPDEPAHELWPFRSYVGALYYFISCYFLILAAVGISGVWMLLRWFSGPIPWAELKENKITALVSLLFFGNLVVHVVGPMLAGTPFTVYAYFNYYAPLGAVIGGLGLAAISAQVRSDYARGALIGGLVVAAFFSLFPWPFSANWPLGPSGLAEINNAAERLAKLTKPDDKIFAVTHMHEFLLADRRPFPALAIVEWGLSVATETDKVQKFNRYNYDLAARWLQEADVVIVSDAVSEGLSRHYKGLKGSGQDVVDLVNKVVAKDFNLVEEVPNSSRGNWKIYRRKSLQSRMEGSSFKVFMVRG